VRDQCLHAFTRRARVRILKRYNNARRTGIPKYLCAGWATRRLMRAWFKRDIDSAAFSLCARLSQSHCFGMRPAALLRPTATDHHIIFDDDATHGRILSGTANAALSQRQGGCHEP
jgi:hypothetical protein